MLRYLIDAVTDAGSSRPLRTANPTSASRLSATSMDSTWPTLTPAMRTLSPTTSPVTSVNRALYEVVSPTPVSAMDSARTVVARAVTTTKTRDFTTGPARERRFT
ncbi:hypothetical protein GA0115239_108412 [Streptomyces sp. BpilaLS-43]|nr:hypothetical protein GA0115239_108412 [Streptomyces sp. BpilaLS-43]